MFRFIFTLMLLLSLLLLTTSCGKSPLQMKKSNDTGIVTGLESAKVFKSTKQSLTLNWLSPINSTDEAHALLIVKHGESAVDLPAQVKIFLWMPMMGHGSGPVTVKKIGTGVYELSSVYFIMDGFWQLRVQLKAGNVVLDEQIFEINI